MKPFRLAILTSIMVSMIFAISITQAQGQPVFRIGVLDDERGPTSSGARLAVKEINDAGGVRGADGTLFRLELVIQSTGGGTNLPTAIANINQAQVIAVLGPNTTEEVLNGLVSLQNLNVPVLTPAIGDTIIASDTSGRIFRTRAAERLLGRALADYLVKDLQLRNILTIQLDVPSTAGVIGFSTEAAALGVQPQSALLLDGNQNVEQLVNMIIGANPQVAVTYGPAEVASELYNRLRAANWEGLFAYNLAQQAAFRNAVQFNQLNGILGTTTWPYSAVDSASNTFLNAYVRAFGSVPGAIEAASYDAVKLLAEAIGLPGDLKSNLTQINNFQGVQGMLSPAQLGRGEMSSNVAVIQLGPLGGAEVRARYAGGIRLPEDTGGIAPTSVPAATATPQGVVLTIKSAVQNVRTGPGQQYDILGQLRQGEQAQIIGANIDFTWVVINYRGQNGWLAASLLDIFGDRSTVPVIAAPPTPTPGPPTPTPTAQPFADIVILNATPATITLNVPFTIAATVFNRGTIDAGPFAVAATFPPDGVYTAVNLPGLGAGQQTIINLTGTITTATGFYNVVIVADLNQQVNEGIDGEANNDDFIFSYKVDKAVLNTATVTLNPGSALTLEGSGAIDVQWNVTGTSLDFPSPPPGSGMYIMTGIASLNDVYYGLINTSITNVYNLNVALLPVNTYIGIVTAEGNRGVMRVDSVASGGPITLTYRVYQP